MKTWLFAVALLSACRDSPPTPSTHTKHEAPAIPIVPVDAHKMLIVPDLSGMVIVPEGNHQACAAYRNGKCFDEYNATPEWVYEFAIDAYEVTVEKYKQCVDAGACTVPESSRFCPSERQNWPARRDHPINCVTEEQAAAYCAFVGKRLPYLIEWERVLFRDSFAGDVESLATCDHAVSISGKCERSRTSPVGTHPKDRTSDGIYDMIGNVSEYAINDTYWPERKYGAHEYSRRTSQRWDALPPGYVQARPMGSSFLLFGGPSFGEQTGFRCATGVVK